MPGNSHNASKRLTAKKGASLGSGGKNRDGLKGRGRTLPADERPWHKAYSGTEPRRGGRGTRAQGRRPRDQGHHVGPRRPRDRPADAAAEWKTARP